MTASPDPTPLPGLADDPVVGLPMEGHRRVACRMCGRPLTGAARARGVGDDCRRKLQEHTAPRPGRFVVEQDGLFGA